MDKELSYAEKVIAEIREKYNLHPAADIVAFVGNLERERNEFFKIIQEYKDLIRQILK